MKKLHLTFLLIAIIILTISCTKEKKQSDSRPNIIYMMADDHASQAISAYQSRLAEIAPTPNLDRIARDGVMFNNCFCTNSICTPSRAVILTGKHSHSNGVLDLADKLDSTTQVTTPMLLQKAGYYTGMIGKWHLHTQPFGFDYWKVMVGQGQYHDPLYWEKGLGWKANNIGAKQYSGYVTDITTNMALEFIANRPKEKPFCLMLHFKAPHDPWDYNEKYDSLYTDVSIPEPGNLFDDYLTRGKGIQECTQKIGNCHTIFSEQTEQLQGEQRKKAQYQIYLKKYLRCIASIDENVGKLLNYLDENGLSNNTIIVYTSDQGFFLGEHGLYDKRFMYEESMKMPLLIKYPAKIEAGQVNNELVSNLDFAETLLDYAGVEIPTSMQGMSLVPLLENRSVEWRDALYYRYWMHGAHFNVPAHFGIRTTTDKLIFFYGHDLGTHHVVNYQDGEIKGADTRLIPWKVEEPYWEYYDLTEDPHEMKNGYREKINQPRISELKIKLRELRETYGDTDEKYPEMKEIIENYWN